MNQRLFAQHRAARICFWGAVGAGFAAIVLLAIQSIVLSFAVAAVFLSGATLADVTPLLLALVVLLMARAAALWLQEVLAQRAAGTVKLALRRDLLTRLTLLGPAFTGGERTGELVNTLSAGVETLDDYITQFLPARALAVLGPAFIFLTIFALDPWTTLVLLVAGPFLLLLLALIGGRAKELTQRRFRELSWMSAFFLDVLQGIATLKLFGRSSEQATNIEEISRHYGKRTMEVLATAFQTSLVMEWAATAATAFVALEVSFRLMNGLLPFDRALAVLLLTPEFFLPLRQMAIKYHAGATGKAAAERIFAILDSQFTLHTSQFTIHNSQFTIHNSQFLPSLTVGVRMVPPPLAPRPSPLPPLPLTVLPTPTTAATVPRCTTSRSRCLRARSRRWSALPVRARAPWPACCCASSNLPAARSWWTVRRWLRWMWKPGVSASPGRRSTRISSTPASPRTSGWRGLAPMKQRLSLRRGPPMPMTSSWRCRRATPPAWASGAPGSAAANASASPSPALSSRTRRCSCSTSRPRSSTRSMSRRSRTR